MSATDGRDRVPRGDLTLGVAGSLRDEVLSGRWPQQARLPADQELARTYGVGMNTVRRAMSLLVTEGLVDRRPGSGTYVIGVPATIARPLLIGLFVPSVRRYFPDLIAGVESVVRHHGGHLVLRSTEYEPTRELREIDELLTQPLDGLVLAPTLAGPVDPLDYLRRIEQIDIPVVLTERMPLDATAPLPGSDLSYVLTDTRRGGYLAVQHLYELGRRRLGLMSSRNTPTSEGFHEGFIRAVHDLGLSADRAIVRWPHHGEEQMEQYLADYARLIVSHRIEGVVCLDDVRARRLLPHLRAAGVAVPDDVAVVAFEDAGDARAEIPLTTVVPARHEVGRIAAQILLRQIDQDGQGPAVQVVVAPQLVVRSSTVAAERSTE